MHRAVAVVAALCLGTTGASAQPAAHALPAGTPLDFVSDDGVNVSTVRPGGQFRVHLKNDLVLDGAVVAPAGTAARLNVVDKMRQPNGTFRLQVALSRFHLPPGDLPVAPRSAVLEAIAVGTDIPARTAGSIERFDGRLVIRVPLPFALTNDIPYGFFTPVPARTPVPRPVPTPRAPRATPTPTAGPAASPSPAPTG